MRRKGRGWEAEDTAAREEAESGVSGEGGRGGLGDRPGPWPRVLDPCHSRLHRWDPVEGPSTDAPFTLVLCSAGDTKVSPEPLASVAHTL